MDYQNLALVLILIFFTIFLFMPLRLIKGKKLKKNNPKPKLPPGPPKLPLIGNLHLFTGTLPHQCLGDLASKHGPLMHLQLGELSTVVISSAEVAQQVMHTHGVNFADRPSSIAASLCFYNRSDTGFAPYGDLWRQLRKICMMELLSVNRVQSFRSIREEEIANFIREISSKAGSPVNLRKRFQSLTYSIISRAAFGVNYKDQDDFTLHFKELLDVIGGFTLADIFPSLKLLHDISGATSKLKNLHQNLDKILQNIIEEHRDRKATTMSCKEEANDLVHVLLNLQDQGDLGIPLSDSTIKAVILDMFIPGGEPSTITLEWAIAEMLKNPRVLENAQTEVRQLFDRKGDVNEKDLQDLRYLKLVIKETLRLHPPSPLDRKYWVVPEKFYPERFLDNSIDFKGGNFELIPFGAGRRICPGISFATAIIELSLAQLLYHFDWKFDDGRQLEDIDMTEASGTSCELMRKHELCLIPIPYSPMSIE
ncbi:hypothetical protein PTKIN_Ptkin14bG0099600 [Pterospermum kingtungense]